MSESKVIKESLKIEQEIYKLYPEVEPACSVIEEKNFFRVIVYGPWIRNNFERAKNIMAIKASKMILIDPTSHY